MEIIKWQGVIVEWVNCLNISKRVQNLSELKNEEFFKKLLQSFFEPTESLQNVSLTDFIQKHYPAYSLDEEPTLIQDELEICNICSLLLHYCCCIDGRKEFTSPLCMNLSSTTQFCIKSFLEYLFEAEIINRESLMEAISNVNKYSSTPKKIINSPKITQNTSLLEFLKTPLKKQQVCEIYKRKVKNLQSQLDLERFEKCDLQEELNLQYEKNKKLDKIITEKQSEIMKLRSELLNIENVLPPSNLTNDNREFKRFKDEIQSLEEYITVLHAEQHDLQLERDRAREKLRRTDESLQEWQNKALNLERHNMKISEENQQQKCELLQLSEKCEELSSILKEINAKNVVDDSYEIDHIHENLLHNRSGSIDYDNLAHTVVDVQLIDAQEENKNLRKQIGELEINTTELSQQVNSLQTEITKIVSENHNLLGQNRNLCDKINSIESELQDTHDRNQNLNICKIELSKKLSETELNFSYYKNECEILTQNLDERKNDIMVISTRNNELQESLKILKAENCDILKQIEECTKTNIKLEEVYAALNDNLKVIVQDYLEKYSSYFEDNFIPHSNQISNVKYVLTELGNRITRDSLQYDKLQEYSNNLSSNIAILQKEISLLFNRETESQKEKNNLLNKIKDLEEDSEKTNKFISILKSSIEDKNKELQNVQNIIKQRDECLGNLLTKNTDLSITVELLQSKINNLQTDFQNIELQLLEEKEGKKNLITILEEAESQLDSNKIKCEEKCGEISALKDLLSNKNDYIEEINEKKAKLNSNYLKLQTELQESQNKIEVLENKNEKALVENITLRSENCQLIEQLAEMSGEYNAEKEAKEELNKNLRNSEIQIQNLTRTIDDEKCKLSYQIEEINTRLSKELETKKNIEENCNQITFNLKEKESVILELKNQKHEMKKSVEKISEELKQEMKIKEETEAKCLELQKIIEEIESQMQILQLDKIKLHEQFEELEKSSRENLEKHQENLNLKIDLLKTELISAEESNNNLKIKLGIMAQSVEEKSKNIYSLEEDRKNYLDEINKLNNQITIVTNKKSELEIELDALKKTLNEREIFMNNLITQVNEKEELIISLNNSLVTQRYESDKTTEQLELQIRNLEQNINLINLEISTIFKMLENEDSIHKINGQDLLATLTSLKNNICNIIFEKRQLENETMNLQEQIFISESLKTTSEEEYNTKIIEYKNKLEAYELTVEQSTQNTKKIIEELEDEVANYKKRENVLSQELNVIQEELRQTIKTHKQTHEDIKKHNCELQETNKNLTQKINELLSNLQELSLEKNTLNSQINEFSTKLNDLEKNRKQVEQEMEQNFKNDRENISNLLDMKKKLEKMLEEEKQKNEQIEHANYDLISICNEYVNKFLDLYLSLFENNDNNDWIKEISESQTDKNEIKDKKKLVNNLFDIITNEISILKKTFNELSNYNDLKTDLATLKTKYEFLLKTEAEKDDLKLKISELKTKIFDLNLANATYYQQILENQLDNKNFEAKYETEIGIMKTTCENLQKIINDNENEHKKLQQDFDSLREKYQQNNDKLESTVIELQRQIKNNNNIIREHEYKHEELYEKYKTAQKNNSSLDQEILDLRIKISSFKKNIHELEEKNIILIGKLEDNSKEIEVIRVENSKLILECQVLRKNVDESKNKISSLTHIKDSYEALLEENNKINMELDTLRYKRTRDKEEFKRILDESNLKSNEQIQSVRNEYEEKLRKMKEKIVKLYREEVEKEKKKVCNLQQGQAEETILALKSQLWVTGNKYTDLKKEYDKLLSKINSYSQQLDPMNDNYSRNSLHSLQNFQTQMNIDDRKIFTLPRDTKIELVEESVTVSRKRRSISAISGLKMEDEEGELFNNTYLADLKAGRCTVPEDRESISSNSSRISEFKYRNSLCPPHLKSSYPAETQFSSPGQFKEEEIKAGAGELDDSITTSLLPGERPRKKDRGQTLYKKPGPPTPSKNGGTDRLSLQGTEVAPLKEQNPPRTSSTPNRIRSLLSKIGRDHSENMSSSTPRGSTKRRSIFKRY